MKILRSTPASLTRVSDFDEWFRHPFVGMPTLGQFFSQLGEILPKAASDKLAVDVHEDKDAYHASFEVPGVPKTGVKLDLEDNVLTIRGERASSQPDGMKTLHRELSPLNYLLRLRLNTPVDEEKLTAKLEDGVLSIQLPLKATAKPRTIAIN